MSRNGRATPRTSPPGPTPPTVRPEGPLATGERFRPFALAALTVVLLVLCVLLATPFLPAITWGVALAVIAWPLHSWVLRRVIENRTWAATLTSALVTAVILVPGVFVVGELAREATSAADHMRGQEAEGTIRERMGRTPGLAQVVGWADRVNMDIDAEVRKFVQSHVGDGAWLAQGSIRAALQAVLALFVLFYMLRDRALLLGSVRRLLPVTRAEAERVFASAANSVNANLYANLLTSLIDAVTGGLLFWALGLPSPVMWGVVMFVLSLLPVAGIFLVWVPAAAYLALIDQWGGAAALVAWGLGSSVLVDTLLYTRLAGTRMRLHPVPTLLSYIGGLAVFGATGMVLGPAILAVTAAVLEVWHYRATGEELPPAEPTTGGSRS